MFEEAVSNLRPFFEQTPSAFEWDMQMVLTNVKNFCEDRQHPLPPVIQECQALFERLTKR